MAVAPRAPGEYAPAAGPRAVENLSEAAAPLRGVRILHVSPAGAPARLPEQLAASLALCAGSGLDVEWRVLFGDADETGVARDLSSGLRGAETALGGERWETWIETCRLSGNELGSEHDIVVLHDAALALAPGLPGAVVWSCHADVSGAETEALALVTPLAEACRLTFLPDLSFGHPDLPGELVAAPPGIDPLDPRNFELEARLPGRVVRPLGVDLERPLCLQVLELDRWDDPHSAIDAVRLAREEEPELQLVLAALLESSDTQGWQAAKEVSDYARGTEGVLLLTSYEGLGSLEVGALQLLARVVIEQSLSEGFETAPCEALWKRTPVVGAAGGGLALVVRDGVDGFLCQGPEDAAARILELVREPGLAAELGRAGRERVRQRFLVTAAVERELRALGDTLDSA